MVRKFSQKHYIEIAKFLKSLNSESRGCQIALIDLDKAFIRLLSEDSSKFDKTKFLKAIGYTQEAIRYI
jgi:hypothetical protein